MISAIASTFLILIIILAYLLGFVSALILNSIPDEHGETYFSKIDSYIDNTLCGVTNWINGLYKNKYPKGSNNNFPPSSDEIDFRIDDPGDTPPI